MADRDPPTTSPALLHLLTLPGAEEAWELFVERYGGLIDARCRAAGLQKADAEDVRASVFAGLLSSMRDFRHDPARRFRGYLQRVVENAIRSHWRTLRRRPGWVGRGDAPAQGDDDAPPEPIASLGAELDDRIWGRVEGVAHAVERVRFEVGEAAWKAFWLTAVEGLSGPEAALRLERSVASVYMAKSRVLARLRREIEGAPPDGA